MRLRWVGAFLLFTLIACGDDKSSGDETPSENSSCFTQDECGQDQYCKATDPLSSPEGSCAPLESAGGSCSYGTHCSDGLFCLKRPMQAQGSCTALPDDCGEEDYCACALTVCEGSLGSCSPSDLENVENSSLVSCSQ